MNPMAVSRGVDLGFVVEEPTKPWKLLSHFFPSKVGGKPSWLAFEPLPQDDLKCANCSALCSFLLQAYAPIDNQPTCFHRTLFVFICRNPNCCEANSNKNIVVLRSQLPRKNRFYSDAAPSEEVFTEGSDYPRVDKFHTVCVVCGCAGNKKCGRCHNVTYCSKEHQTIDWTAGGHKAACGVKQGSAAPSTASSTNVLFKELELDYEEEEEDDSDTEEKTVEENLRDYQAYLESTAGAGPDLPVAELERMAQGHHVDDKQFAAFRKRISLDPKQVIRYQRGGEPLWITDKPIPVNEDIPACAYCGGSRQFEFQIMPQLLTYLDVDQVGKSIDWGTLVVYTCSASCDKGGQYGKEFVWKQDFDSRA